MKSCAEKCAAALPGSASEINLFSKVQTIPNCGPNILVLSRFYLDSRELFAAGLEKKALVSTVVEAMPVDSYRSELNHPMFSCHLLPETQQ